MRDIHHNIAVVQTLDPAVTTADRVGAPVDRRGFEAAEHLVLVGASGDALSGSVFIELKLEHSEDGSNWSAVTLADDVLGGPVDSAGTFATVDAVAEDQTTYRIGYVGNARYSRVAADLTGTHTNGTPVGAVAILSAAHVKPTV